MILFYVIFNAVYVAVLFMWMKYVRCIQFSAADRMTVTEALEHEFLASQLGLKFLQPLSQQSEYLLVSMDQLRLLLLIGSLLMTAFSCLMRCGSSLDTMTQRSWV